MNALPRLLSITLLLAGLLSAVQTETWQGLYRDPSEWKISALWQLAQLWLSLPQGIPASAPSIRNWCWIRGWASRIPRATAVRLCADTWVRSHSSGECVLGYSTGISNWPTAAAELTSYRLPADMGSSSIRSCPIRTVVSEPCFATRQADRRTSSLKTNPTPYGTESLSECRSSQNLLFYS